jgi:pyruvate,water dikinase
MGKDPRKAFKASSVLYGHIPERIDIPTIPVPRWRVLLSFIAVAKSALELKKIAQNLPEFVKTAPAEVSEKRARIQAIKTPCDLAKYWQSALEPLLVRASQSILACFYDRDIAINQAIQEVNQMVGDEQATSLLAGWSTYEEYIESLGPLLGLLKIQRGKMTPRAYSEHYGHRGGDEFEFSKPSPNEDPDWIDQRLSEQADELSHLEALLAAQQTRRQTALTRFKADHPEQAELMESRLEQAAQAIHLREKARSEATRVMRLARDFALQAAELTGLGEDIFFLYIDEVLDLLKGSDYALQFIPARRETDRRYRALPPLPAVIRGRFNAFAWEKDPNQRSDLFDASVSSQVVVPQPVKKETIVGFPGSAGVVEGSARLLSNLDQADELVPGEILVTNKLDIGWTLLFPKCSGIVTDIGAPLSHAAIVARELGIPAVVGCGDATHFLQTGLRVRVDGVRGTVDILNT